jgi:hypothetical protein
VATLGHRLKPLGDRVMRGAADVAHLAQRSAGDVTRRFKRRTPARHVGWIPFVLILTAIVVLAGAGITWVTSPYWHKQVTIAAPRDVGTVPVKAGATVAYISPFRIEIPRLAAVAPIVDVSTLPGGELDVPLNPKVVGWWKYGAKPGAARGTAILDGHINFAGVDGVLARIGTLNPGDTVYVYGVTAGKTTRLGFKITGVRTYNKQALPYKEIFDQKSVGRLAIVTCGGPFDASTGNYLDNIVAFAVPA